MITDKELAEFEDFKEDFYLKDYKEKLKEEKDGGLLKALDFAMTIINRGNV